MILTSSPCPPSLLSLGKFNVKDVGIVKEKIVDFGMDEV
jgi:hypothetical protein